MPSLAAQDPCVSSLPDSQRPRSPVAGREPDELVSGHVLCSPARIGQDLCREQQLRGERVEQSLPLPSRGMNPEITGVLIANHEMAEFVSSSGTASPRIACEADNRYRDIAINHR